MLCAYLLGRAKNQLLRSLSPPVSFYRPIASTIFFAFP